MDMSSAKDRKCFTKTLEVLQHHCTIQYNCNFSLIVKDPPDNVLLTFSIPKKPDKTSKNYEFENEIYPHQLK